MKDMSDQPSRSSDLQTYGRLLRYVWPLWPLFLLSTLGFIVFNGAQVLAADMMQFILDAIGGEQNLARGIVSSFAAWFAGGTLSLEEARLWIPAAIVVLGVLRGIGFFIGHYFLNFISRHLVHELRCNVFDQLLVAPSSEYDRYSTGFLISRLTFNVEQVTGAATDAVKVMMREGIFVTGLLTYLFWANWKLSLTFLGALPLVALIVLWVGKRFRKLSHRVQSSMGDVTHVASETISAYREVRLFGGVEQERRRFVQASDNNRQRMMKIAFYNALSPPVIQFPVVLVLAFLIYQAVGVLTSMTPGEFVAYLSVAMLLPKPIRQLSEVNSTIQKGLAGAEDVFGFIDSEKERDTGRHAVDQLRGEVEFRHVDFRYQPDTPLVLHDINLHVQPGQTVALVGLSGSGKSTLVSLLARFYNHDSGEILLDGVEVNEYELANLRRHIALVTQHVTLFDDTIYNNIAYGELAHRDPEQVYAAARAAQALEFIERLPQGFDTRVGEDGVMLSGGQRQRLAIARALLKDAPLLILDEATSALDNRAEAQIQAALEGLMEGRTTIVIAHRLSTIEKADLIIVMEAGQIIERGTHSELLGQGGRYAELHQRHFEAS